MVEKFGAANQSVENEHSINLDEKFFIGSVACTIEMIAKPIKLGRFISR